MNIIWLIKLILSHLLTDFMVQPKKWVSDRELKHFMSPWLYIHGLITGSLALFFIGLNYWHFVRFSEKDQQEVKTEYVLIGSLISVTFALVTGIIVNKLL
ncbi:MAG TPA: DUF3307 domain-containing protein [Chitinophagaceae bacterium]|nr:DUF3307 domain-containing protein [Chitinophagaceae bacterium]